MPRRAAGGLGAGQSPRQSPAAHGRIGNAQGRAAAPGEPRRQGRLPGDSAGARAADGQRLRGADRQFRGALYLRPPRLHPHRHRGHRRRQRREPDRLVQPGRAVRLRAVRPRGRGGRGAQGREGRRGEAPRRLLPRGPHARGHRQRLWRRDLPRGVRPFAGGDQPWPSATSEFCGKLGQQIASPMRDRHRRRHDAERMGLRTTWTTRARPPRAWC